MPMWPERGVQLYRICLQARRSHTAMILSVIFSVCEVKKLIWNALARLSDQRD